MLHIPTVLRTRRRVNAFSFFDDDELAALAPAIDTFSADVVAGHEPQTTLVHDYNCEVGHRRAERELAERRAARQ
jgi:hypothetical protein